MALMGAQKSVPDHRASDVQAAISRAVEFACSDRNINRVDRDEILWAVAYRVRLLSRMVDIRPELKGSLQNAVLDLESIQTKRGTWYHEYSNPFVTATALIALHDAQQAGAAIDKLKIELGVSALSQDRFANGAFPYFSGQAARDADEQKQAERAPADAKQLTADSKRLAAGAGRMPVCELALWLWKKSDDSDLQQAIEISMKHHRHLHSALKYDDHTSNMAYGGFFFWYDMRGRSEAIANLRDPASRNPFVAAQKDLIFAVAELDGCFVDSHELGRSYGTAMALLCLELLNR
jgi:hypothetical protein